MKNKIIKTIIFTAIFISPAVIFNYISGVSIASAQTITGTFINGNTYTIYGGNNIDDSITSGWIAGSDNVVWDFGQTKMVYRLIKSLSLKYNPGGEFHVIRSSPLDISGYKYLTFVGRADDEDLNFSLSFIDADNQPIGTPVKFSDFGGIPSTNYWTQYNFPLESFHLPSIIINGIKISQISSKWLAVVYLDEMYLSDLRGEDINPAINSPTPTPNPTLIDDQQENSFFPEINPLIFIIPFAFIIIAMFFH